jgi:hypothetical protein
VEESKYRYLGPVGDNLKKKKEQGRTGWCIPIDELKAAIEVYENAPTDEEDDSREEFDFSCVVFSINSKDNELYILGVNKEKIDDESSPANSPRDPGEFNQFPPWPPKPVVDN